MGRDGGLPGVAATDRELHEAGLGAFEIRGGRGLRGFADSMRTGLPASGPEARELAEQHRQFLTTWFYDCGYAMHRQLGEMYVADPRFTQVYDVVEPGLAAYVRDAIVANADAQQASPD